MDLDGALELMERMLTHPHIQLHNLSVYLTESATHHHAIEYMRHICQILLRRVEYPINLTLNGRSIRGQSSLSEQEKLNYVIMVPVGEFTKQFDPYPAIRQPCFNEGVLLLVRTEKGPVWTIRKLQSFQITYTTMSTKPEYRKDGHDLSFQEAIKYPMTDLLIGTRSSVRTPSYTSLQCALTDGLSNLSPSDKVQMTCSKTNESFTFPYISWTPDGFIQFPKTIYFFCISGCRDCTISFVDT